MPIATPSMLLAQSTWDYMSQPDQSMFESYTQNQIPWPSAKVLGGSSTINYMIYSRGNPEDYKKMKHLQWGYKDVMPYFLKSEASKLSAFDLGYHNLTGLMSVETSYAGDEVDDFLKAAKELGHNMTDYNGKNQLGFSTIQAFLKRGGRESSYTATFKHDIPINVEIVTNAFVTKLAFLQEGTQVKSVKFIKDNQKYRAVATKEFLLCAGTFNSPKILMLSGVGPSDHLESLKINVVKDLPGVGANLGDHIAYPGLNFIANYNKTQFDIFKEILTQTPMWFTTGQGPLSSLGGFEALGFIKLLTSPLSQHHPDIEILFQNTPVNPSIAKIGNMKPSIIKQLYNNTQTLIQFSIIPILLHPTSRGYIRLLSKNPRNNPQLETNYLAQTEDQYKLIEGIKFVLNLSKTKIYQDLGVKLNPNLVPGCEAWSKNNDGYNEYYWECAIKKLATTAYDPFGTCRMGLDGDPNGVVTPKLKLQGVENLRVVDASVIPNTISGNLGAVVVMIAERAADFIKQDYQQG